MAIQKGKIVFFSMGTLLLLVMFIFSTYKYQQIANEISVISDKQCLNVNPLIIKRKKSYIRTLQIAQAEGSKEEFWEEQANYLFLSKKYVKAQKLWLESMDSITNRLDFRIFVPKTIQKASQLQYESREADMKATIAIIDMFKFLSDLEKQKELSRVVIKELAKQESAESQLEKLWNSEVNLGIRSRFVKIPETKCSAESFDIPDVSDFFAPLLHINNSPLI